MAKNSEAAWIEPVLGAIKELDRWRPNLERVLRLHRKMLDAATGLRVGDRVEICRDLKIEPSSGWWCHRKNLLKGAQGTVAEVGFNEYREAFTVDFLPDHEYYLSSLTNDWIETTARGTYCLNHDAVRKLGPGLELVPEDRLDDVASSSTD